MIRSVFRAVALGCALLLCFGPAPAAQSLPPSPPPQPEVLPFVPVLRVHGAEQPVRLRTLSIHTAVRGGLAEISLDMIFHNPNNRVLEGELQFPLLPGQEISGLALDIQGEMRPGVPVPKARGQEIFEAVARRNVDPALLEATQGNAYKLRIYPIPARGTRRVAVRILQPLAERDGLFTLSLPLTFAKHIDNFSVEAVVAAGEPPRVDSGSLGLVLEQVGLLYCGKVEKTDLSPEGWLVISLPASKAPGKNLDAVRWGDKVYFTATASVERRTLRRSLPKTVTLVWDASGSGRNRDHGREFDLLDRYFAALGDGLARLVVVRNVAEAPKEFSIRGGDWREMKSYLHGLAYDGGTNLAAWKPAEDCAEYLLFTDGLANFGNSREEDALSPPLPGQRLYAIASSTEADHNLLRHASGGRLVDLLRHDTDAAARLLLEDATRVSIAPEDLAGKGEALLDPLDSPADSAANRLTCRLAGWIAARANAGAETVTLHVEHPDGQRETAALVIPLDEAVPVHKGDDAPLSARLWGRYAIAEMEANAARHRAAIARLGQELGIVSRETSLIVLETADDYLRYDVPPPAALRDEVERLRSRNGTGDKAVAYLPMEKLRSMWAEKVAWWEKDFSRKPSRKRKVQREEMRAAPPMTSTLYAEAEPFPDYGSAGEYYDGFAENRPDSPPMERIEIEDHRSAPRQLERSPSVASVAPSLELPSASDAAGFAPASPAPARRMARISEQAMATTEEDANFLSQVPRGDTAGTAAGGFGIALQTWKSDAPYIERMNRAKKEDMYAIYLDERPGHAGSSAFFLDMADRFFAAKMPELGLRVLSNLVEIEVENRQLLRMLAYRLLEAREPGLALGVLEKVRELAPYEPQSLRDLANAHIALGNHAKAGELLYEVAHREWDGRFPGVNIIALTELNALIAASGGKMDASAFDSRLIANLPSDLRVVLTWDADNTDMDLWVTDPDGEKCFYENRLTALGGAMSPDCTGGYGPEEFMIRKAKPGVYRVEVDYYGSTQQILSGDVTLYVTLATAFGTAGQEEQVITMRLRNAKDKVLVGEFTVR